ncbi:MAG: hypothetical protein HN737_00035 [Desulfobacterales bacterium]|jgi:hypothetical protein|nr:hypothetical protein [Desulfobacteraceae bacterium]MBT4362965.1 hypothetical protein [Desulfobacteraceae bacterium]MBT7086874.1 hypothetical protein [Desulfobacterales bacterium]MBT7695779.1 hypothetical protein [Desulfobacterales bacterium]
MKRIFNCFLIILIISFFSVTTVSADEVFESSIDKKRKEMVSKLTENVEKNLINGGSKNIKEIKVLGIFEMAEKNSVAYFAVTENDFTGYYFWALDANKNLYFNLPEGVELLNREFFPFGTAKQKDFLRAVFTKYSNYTFPAN